MNNSVKRLTRQDSLFALVSVGFRGRFFFFCFPFILEVRNTDKNSDKTDKSGKYWKTSLKEKHNLGTPTKAKTD